MLVEDIWNKKSNFNSFFKYSIKELFKISIISYLFFHLVDIYFHGIVTNSLNLNILLFVVVFTGIYLVFSGELFSDYSPLQEQRNIFYLPVYVLVTFLIYFLIFKQIAPLGNIKYALTLVITIVIFIDIYLSSAKNK